MTKSEVRSVCLSKLQLTQDAVCWDVGAGTGSVSIEMAIQASRGRVYAIEKNEQALALLQENKTRFSQENLDIVPGAAPQACEALPAPTHVFLGGTSGNLPEILALILHKNPHARIVATAVTLESAAALTGCMKNFKSADCISMQVSKASAAGSYHLMKAQNPVWIFTLQNGGALFMKWSLYALLLGSFLDLLIGDPHGFPHPVIAIGKLISVLERFFRRLCPKNTRGEILAGGLIWFFTAAISTAVPVLLLFAAQRISVYLRLALESVMCWQILAAKSLQGESMKVYAALKTATLPDAQKAVSMIVGRDTEPAR